MKKFIIVLSFVIFCLQLSAQEKIDAFKLISDVCENNISADEFKHQYVDYFTKDQDKNSTDLGIFALEKILFAGYESNGMVIINPEAGMKIVAILPNYEVLDSISRYQAADKCHEHLIAALGQPDNEENTSLDNPMVQQITGELKIKEGKTYTWVNNTTVPHASMRYKTDKEDFYILMVMSMASPYSTTTPIQRQFFRTLEFGKYVTKQQIATALEISSYEIEEERKSSGKTYHYWKSVYFGGIEWSFIEISTVEGKLATVRLTDSQLKDNKYIYDRLLEALTNKYGEPKDYETSVLWNDGTTAVELSHSYSESKGGEMRHYVNIEYTDIELFREAQNIITNEL